MTNVPSNSVADAIRGTIPHAELGKQLTDRVLSEVSRVVVGVDDVVRQLLIALIANGHVLLEGVPGVAKTTLSKTFAKLLGCQYQRVQFTPDLLPSDVTGTSILDRKTNDFVLRKGPIFTQLLLADEINRAPAKTQSALLEAMQEYQVTVDGASLPLPRPFLVMATQNPIEQEGVYRLPEAQLDRFLVRIEMSYPGHDSEVRMLQLHSHPTIPLEPMFSPESIEQLQNSLPSIHASEELLHYIVNLAEVSREHPDVALGASPRAALCLLRCARAHAMLEGRSFCTHADVQAMALPVLGHRLIIRPEAEIEGRRVADILGEILDSVPVVEKPKSRN
ncbi:AAA family ATPase [Tuwongella immobilis]|uniref:AAA+ ATPase domain-containing protein n=1 Tax=Tuwongella immobilis TaxID=692036 RepID=A0A6C2YPA3_9BACT|nr:MoxR family ATPase [Tuwongella immobilis]VIP03019.1 atpase : ATPase associated with various cellular activities AAA_3 OS=Thermincola potens (strain JR) GN=TherJR_0783 PE=4 SV=1: AAA_3 [Tuwongella immobilis]VTS03145.1 atpase : ATPase associated with various cellular activities AAA_3 OS=Thermincola potens (strain JR) GN=TherJR_0783 PE=4 SV=1: AAA_3 [Tuwongella immobilis]